MLHLVTQLLGHGSLILGLIGVLANCIAIATLTRNKELSSYFFNWLLTTLTILDTMFLACGAYEAVKTHFTHSYIMNYLHVEFIHPVRSMLMVSSTYMMIVLSYERYRAVSGTTAYQGNVNDILNPWRHLMTYVVPVLLGSIIFYLPKFWELELALVQDPMLNTTIANVTNSSSVMDITFTGRIVSTPLRHNSSYVLWYVTILNTLMTSVVPFAALVYLNIKIYLGLQRILDRRRTLRMRVREQPESATYHERVKRNESQTMLLLLIVCVFLFCHALRFVLNMAEIITHESERKATENGCFGVQYWMLIAAIFSNFLVYLNSSANLFVYCIANEHLRGILINSFTSRFHSLKEHSNRFCWY